MARNNIDIVGSELVIERIVALGDVSPYSISFESPTVELVLDRIKFYERGIYKISLGLTDINEIGGIAPTDIVDAYNKILNSIINLNGYATEEWVIENTSQGYLGILSPFYFDGEATSSEIVIGEVDTWMDLVMTIDPLGVSDFRVQDMKTAQAQGYEGTGALGSPIKFLLEGLVEKSFATLRASLSFVPDEDGGRLDSRLFLERHTGAGPDFTINAAGLAMESGADELYPHLISTQFFVGDTIDTNGVGDAGKVRFQIKSDVTGTVSMNEMALFINR